METGDEAPPATTPDSPRPAAPGPPTATCRPDPEDLTPANAYTVRKCSSLKARNRVSTTQLCRVTSFLLLCDADALLKAKVDIAFEWLGLIGIESICKHLCVLQIDL